jgi:uncharacterized GH25 family protein
MKELLAAVVWLLMATTASAHFPFIVPADDRSEIQVVFNDRLEQDQRVPIDRIAETTLFMVDADGMQTPLKWTKGPHALEADLSGMDFLVIGGFTNRGFVQSKHTENKPVWIKHYPKAVVGDLALASDVRLGELAPLELAPILDNGRLRFLALWKGAPMPNAEVAVLAPGESKARDITTDARGITNDAFDQPGTYGARTGSIEHAEGKLDGKKYEEIRYYATLVVQLAATGALKNQ